ncbi:MAG: 2-phospho-L-lactate transferase [Archaeoglobaceae archaeon]
MLVLSGGTGTPKLLRGLKEIADFWVVANTAEDIWVSGNKVCPDIDSVIYALAEVIDEQRWWGIAGDTFTTHEALKGLGFDEVLMIGDRDRATHILRSEMLRRGYSLCEATVKIARAYGVKQDVYPMCEEEVATVVVTSEGEMHFQEFWVKRKGEPEVVDVRFEGIENARIPQPVRERLEREEEVLIGPSNPITSIMPILSVEDFAELLKDKKVVAVSPIVGNRAVSGPAAKFMRAKGYEVSPLGVMKVYEDFIDALIVHESDAHLCSDSVFATNTIMRNKGDAVKLAEFIIKIFDKI